MARMKTFGLYALIVILFMIFSNVMINLATKAVYGPMTVYLNTETGEDIEIAESKSTHVNAIVKGKFTNNTKQDINNKYLRIDIYSRRDNLLDTKYVALESLKAGDSQEFTMGFKSLGAVTCTMQVVDEAIQNSEDTSFISEEVGKLWIAKWVIILCFV